ncbi:uncharacterized protein LOC112344034 [Selaginella moellendorffii]|uniref:uncharacterized protein LOC112344034 n=1 Tax=Selaginella moellendorffii TaxID=88036 RepID=UPI000D1CDDA2|nr:uncharacterized protein LOC112344034 [Selaginella moellendorffii]|eukprot:XP_024523930.1 uncharacterized protein LOC112344034 [Selaginella moellendorffii]
MSFQILYHRSLGSGRWLYSRSPFTSTVWAMEDLDHSFVLWNKPVLDENEPSSPVLFKASDPGDVEEKPQKQQDTAEDLYKLYEQLTGPFQEFTLKDFVSGIKQNGGLDSPANDIAVPSKSSSISPRNSLHGELCKESPASSPWNRPRSPMLPANKRVRPTPSCDASFYQSPKRSGAPIPVEHGTDCHICNTKAMIVKTRCLVCGKVYCRKCVKEGMGSMLEGRKCRSCLGHRFNPRYIDRAGKGWWISNRVKQVEMRWATKRSRAEFQSLQL